MRSRFTAFALADAEHLLRTWHPRTRPTARELADLEHGPRWHRLVVHEADGGPADDEGTVRFTAIGRGPDGEKVRLRERSRFERLDGDWLYVEGELEA